jgi:outer membrane protein assembly factor BamB
MVPVSQLIFVGLNGWVCALDRDTGEQVWCCSELKSGYTTLLLDGDRLIASTNGYVYCLDPQNGKVVWSNPLRGFGTGVAHLVSSRGQNSQVLLSEKARIDAETSSHGGAAAHAS